MTGAPISSVPAEKEGLSPVATETAPTPDGDEPNAYEKSTLRRIGENLPASAYLIAIVELTERFTYYGAQGLFQNYISFSKTGADGPRGLGMGSQAATGLNLFFQWFCYGMRKLVGDFFFHPMYMLTDNQLLPFSVPSSLISTWASTRPS